MVSDSVRLTKKQKKASAFRDRKGKKKKGEILDVPAVEDEDFAEQELESAKEAVPASKRGKVSESITEDTQKPRVSADIGVAPSVSSKKRKRDNPESTLVATGGDDDLQVKKKRKNRAGAGEIEEESTAKTRRFILFVGNLRYTTSREAILEHFSACDPPPIVRLLTPKQTRPGATVAKSKGCAFLEFSTNSSLQQALKLHHSEVDGRKINVELTAGGGGKGDERLAKLQKRNKELSAQRAKRLSKSNIGEDGLIHSQRFSTTSGEASMPKTKHTWTVGDTMDEETHRGGKKVKKRGKKPKDMGTGVNAIPVG